MKTEEVDNSTKWFEHFWNLKFMQRAEFVKEKGLLINFRILQNSEKIIIHHEKINL